METALNINGMNLGIKQYNGERVVTFKDIDAAHERPEGTASRNFRKNKNHFIEGVDYFKITPDEFRRTIGEMDSRQQNDIVLVTESGYLMISKSFHDAKSWEIQRALVNGYFKFKDQSMAIGEISPELQALKGLIDGMMRQELKQKEQDEKLNALDNKLDNIRDITVFRPDNWRKEVTNLVQRIAYERGNGNYIKAVYGESYDLLEKRINVNLSRRLTFKRKRMAKEGVSASKQQAVTKIDIIAEDKKLVEAYVAILKELAIKYGVMFNNEIKISNMEEN